MQGSDFCLHISVCLCAQNAFSLFRSLLLFFRSALQLLAQPFFSPPPHPVLEYKLDAGEC